MSEYTIKWTSPNNDVIWLSGESYYTVVEGDGGWFMPGINLMFNYYNRHATISRVRYEPRIITMPLYIQTSTQHEMDNAITTLCNAFNPLSEQEGTLRVIRHDGTIREIKAIYWNGLEGVRSRDRYNKLWYKTDLTLKCPNPSWYDPEIVTNTYETGSPGLFFPILPMQLAPGALYGDNQINNPGTLDAWPIWTIQGPATNPELTNLETGLTLRLTLSIGSAETLVIDTRPGKKTISIGAVNKFNTTSIDSSLWPLVPGVQMVRTTVSNTTPASSVTYEFNPRFVTL